MQVLHTDVADLADELLALEPVPLLSSHGARAAGRGGGRRAAGAGSERGAGGRAKGRPRRGRTGWRAGAGGGAGRPARAHCPAGAGAPGGREEGGAGREEPASGQSFFFSFFSSPTPRVDIGWIV